MADTDADTEKARESLIDLDGLSQRFGRSITRSFAMGAIEGKRFEDVLRSLGTRLSDIALSAALKPLGDAFGSGLGSLFKGFSGAFSGLFSSGAGQPMNIQPFASGGVVSSPTYFPMGSGLGLMGEAGAEAIMPLSRGPDGRLGVSMSGGAAPVSVNVTIATPDAESFRRSEAQVAGALARAVSRGQRGL